MTEKIYSASPSETTYDSGLDEKWRQIQADAVKRMSEVDISGITSEEGRNQLDVAIVAAIEGILVDYDLRDDEDVHDAVKSVESYVAKAVAGYVRSRINDNDEAIGEDLLVGLKNLPLSFESVVADMDMFFDEAVTAQGVAARTGRAADKKLANRLSRVAGHYGSNVGDPASQDSGFSHKADQVINKWKNEPSARPALKIHYKVTYNANLKQVIPSANLAVDRLINLPKGALSKIAAGVVVSFGAPLVASTGAHAAPPEMNSTNEYPSPEFKSSLAPSIIAKAASAEAVTQTVNFPEEKNTKDTIAVIKNTVNKPMKEPSITAAPAIAPDTEKPTMRAPEVTAAPATAPDPDESAQVPNILAAPLSAERANEGLTQAQAAITAPNLPKPAPPPPPAEKPKPAPAKEVQTPEKSAAYADEAFEQIIINNVKKQNSPMNAGELTSILNNADNKYNHPVITREVILAVSVQESRLDPHAVSPVGAAGLTQFMPGTAADYGLTDSFDPKASVDASFRYYIAIYDQLAGKFPDKSQDELLKLTLAGYNAGQNRADIQSGHLPQITETLTYVDLISSHVKRIYDAEKPVSTPPPSPAEQASNVTYKKVGKVAYTHQQDRAFDDMRYEDGASVGFTACGAASLDMVANTIGNKPGHGEVMRTMLRDGTLPQGGTNQTYIMNEAPKFGLRTEYVQNYSITEMKKVIDAGGLITFSGRSGTNLLIFPGHFVVVYDVDVANGTLQVADPGNPANNGKWFSLQAEINGSNADKAAGGLGLHNGFIAYYPTVKSLGTVESVIKPSSSADNKQESETVTNSSDKSTITKPAEQVKELPSSEIKNDASTDTNNEKADDTEANNAKPEIVAQPAQAPDGLLKIRHDAAPETATDERELHDSADDDVSQRTVQMLAKSRALQAERAAKAWELAGRLQQSKK